jgi:hypothetical protein
MKMRENPALPIENLSRGARATAFACLLCVSALLAGCFGLQRKQPARGWNPALLLKPVYVPQPAAVDLPQVAAPEIAWELPEISLQAVPIRSTPPRPKITAPVNASINAETEKTDPPAITIQLTPQESTLAQQQASESIRIAQANLKAAHGRTLNYAQADLASKASGFLKDATEAATNGDWSTARTLAKKAQVLSEELVASL